MVSGGDLLGCVCFVMSGVFWEGGGRVWSCCFGVVCVSFGGSEVACFLLRVCVFFGRGRRVVFFFLENGEFFGERRELDTLIFFVLHCHSWKVDRLRIHLVLNLQCVGKCFQSSYVAGGVMIVPVNPVNRVAMAPRD